MNIKLTDSQAEALMKYLTEELSDDWSDMEGLVDLGLYEEADSLYLKLKQLVAVVLKLEKETKLSASPHLLPWEDQDSTLAVSMLNMIHLEEPEADL